MKISILKIFVDHKNTLVDDNNNKLGADDLLIFIVIPFLVSFVTVFICDFNIDNLPDIKKTLVGSLAIFVGLLFNSLVMIINLAREIDKKQEKRKYKVVNQLIANIAFSIMIAFFVVILVLFRYIVIQNKTLASIYQHSLDFIILIGLINFFFTFLMVMKRTYAIVNVQVNKKK